MDVLDLQNQNKEQNPLPEEERRKTLLEKLTHERRVSFLGKIEGLLHVLTPGERLVLYTLTGMLATSALALLIAVNAAVSSTIPSQGGEFVEGAVGTPRFVNPLLAISQTDQDLTALVYSGLMRATPEGDLVPDLARDFEVSEDGTKYTFHIREGATFQNGTPVSAHDVAFTVSLAQDPDIKSPRRADWEGVDVEATDDRTVVFTLPHAYAPFLENMQLGILPKTLWENISPDEFPFHMLNTHPIGSGPYTINDITLDDVGTPLSYELTPFDNFALGAPNLAKIVFRFYSNEDDLLSAFEKEDIDSFAGISPEKIPQDARTDTRVMRAASTRIFAVFLNQNHAPVLADSAVREALSIAIDRTALIETVLSGYGMPAESPIPPGLFRSSDTNGTTSPSADGNLVETARTILSRGGWVYTAPTATSTPDIGSRWTKKNQTLSFALATADTPELVKTAQSIAGVWRELGVDVTVQVYPLSEFNTTVLRPRSYDAVLFGEVVGRSLDLFAFWHSSQRNDPGLNLALYANARADRALASGRTELDKKKRDVLYQSFADIVAEDTPAIFLYAPEFLYVAPIRIHDVSLGALTVVSERFLNVHRWYTDTERVWDIFNNQASIDQ